jgi:hypothetical protein
MPFLMQNGPVSAGGGARTHTILRSLDFESSVLFAEALRGNAIIASLFRSLGEAEAGVFSPAHPKANARPKPFFSLLGFSRRMKAWRRSPSLKSCESKR